MIWHREMLLFFRNKLKLFTSFFLPTILILFLGNGLATFFPNYDSSINFPNFFYSGIFVLSIVVNVFDATISLVWDKEFGFMREILVAPLSKTEIVIGKIAGATTRGLMQGILLLILAPVLNIFPNTYQLFLLIILIILISISIAGLGIITASYMKRIESFQLISQILLSPLLFLSGAFFTLERIPRWMQYISMSSPLFYAINSIRFLLFENDFIPIKMSGLLIYNFNFAFIITFLFAIVSFGMSIMIFNRVKLTTIIKKIIEETEDMI